MWGPPAYRFGYKAAWFPDEPVTQQATHFSYADQSFSFSAPLWHDDINVWSTNIGVRSEIFSTAAILPDTHQPFPDELWNIHFGTSFRHQFDNGWSEISSISLGSASDKPFAPTDRLTIGFNEMVRIPQGEHNAWLFSLSYSNNSELPFPIPGVAYLYQPSETFRATVGVPFSLMWRPREDLTIDASYALIRQVHARVTYAAAPVRLFTAFDWGDEAYFLSDRPTSDDRFYYYDKRLTAGVQWPLTQSLKLELSGGYIFERFYTKEKHPSRIVSRIASTLAPGLSSRCSCSPSSESPLTITRAIGICLPWVLVVRTVVRRHVQLSPRVDCCVDALQNFDPLLMSMR